MPGSTRQRVTRLASDASRREPTRASETLVVRIDADFTEDAFVALLRAEAACAGPFRLILEVSPAVPVTLELARAWLAIAIDPQIPLTELIVVSSLVRAHVLTQAVSLAAGWNGVGLPVEVFRTLEGALRWRVPQTSPAVP